MKSIIFLRRETKILLFLFCIFIGNHSNMFAQDYLDICVTDEIQTEDLSAIYSNAIDTVTLQELGPAVVNIYFWRINDQNGNIHPWALSEQKALEAIQYLNIAFNPSGIFFKYRGWGSFDSPSEVTWTQHNYSCEACDNMPFGPNDPCNINPPSVDPDGYSNISRCQTSLMVNYAIGNENYYPNMLNVYVPWGTTDFGGVALGSPGNKLVTSTGGLTKNTFLHEVGHSLGLSHTDLEWRYSVCEHVSRDINDPCDPGNPTSTCFNANYRGDKVIDTAAMPEFAREYCFINQIPLAECVSPFPDGFRFYYYDIDECKYIGTIEPNQRVDCGGTLYQIDEIQSRNTMSYAPGDCKDNFTVGQGIKMKETIANSSILQPIKEDDVSSLYEPYVGEYYVAGPNQDPRDKPLFQPGFNYRFVECDCDPSCPEPAEFSDISFNFTNNSVLTIPKEVTDFTTITHPNHTAIEIDFITSFPFVFQTTRRCYDNWNKTPSGGSITQFNDGVFNTNVTITLQDSTHINNPNLIYNLQQGLYKIEKTYDDGGVQETIIIKENN